MTASLTLCSIGGMLGWNSLKYNQYDSQIKLNASGKLNCMSGKKTLSFFIC